MNSWCVVYTQAQSEAKAAGHLRRQGFNVYLPEYYKLRRHARKKERIKSPLFSRYLFVALDMTKDRWRAINSTIGVSHLICCGDRPRFVSEKVIAGIRDREDKSGIVALNVVDDFKSGDSVQIQSGAFCDQIGILDCVTSEERVRVLLNLLGRSVKLNLPVNTIAAFS